MSLDLAAIRARAQAATPGPWVRQEWPPTQIDVADGVLIYDDNNLKDADAAFIAHARQDIPALCDRVEALERMLSHTGILRAQEEHNALRARVEELERREAEARALLTYATENPITLAAIANEWTREYGPDNWFGMARAWLAGSPQPKGAP